MKKNVLKVSGILSLFILMFTLTTAFTTKTTSLLSDDYSCVVTVKYDNGSLAKNVKVSTDVSGGMSCVGGRDFYTNSDGKVVLEWSKGCYLKKVYVKGSGYNVDYKDGNTYVLVIN